MTKARKTLPPKGTSRGISSRSLFALVILLVAMLLLCIRFAYLQIFDPEDYRDAALNQYTNSVTIAAKRGTIYAGDGTTELAVSATVYNCFISPHHINEKVENSQETDTPLTFDEVLEIVSDGLSKILSVDKTEIHNKGLKTNSQYQMIKKFLSESEEAAVRLFIEEQGLERVVHLEETTKRYYRYGSLASHLIGFTGVDNQGLSGIESVYNEYLSGVNGKAVNAADGYGNELDSGVGSTYIPAVNGYNVVTTIDWSIQNTVEKYVRQCYDEHQPNGRVQCIVMDVDSGALLASAIYPNYDPNNYTKLSDFYQSKLDVFVGTEEKRAAYKTELLYEMWNNTVATQTYEPGSTFKIITSAMALEDGVIDANTTTFYCNGGQHVLDQEIHCHDTSGHGTQTFAEAIVNSCNPAFIQIGSAVGTKRFKDYFKEFGYTEVTGSDLLGEVSSIYYQTTGAQFEAVELATYSFGQTFKVTPIQHLRAMSAVANGGYLVFPHTVKSLVDDEGNTVKTFEYESARQVISEETCDIIMKSLVNSTKNASVSGYNVVSKTGTSEKRDTPEDDYISSCVTFAPAEDPQIAVMVLVDDPTMGQYYGSAVAAPVVANVLTEVLPHLGISPDKNENSVTVPNVGGKTVDAAKEAIKALGDIDVVVRGNGDKVIQQLPAQGTVIGEEGVVILYTEGSSVEADATVPNVVGLSPSRAIKALINADLNVSVKGIFNDDYSNCKAISQSVPAGQSVLPGTVIEIEFLYEEAIE